MVVIEFCLISRRVKGYGNSRVQWCYKPEMAVEESSFLKLGVAGVYSFLYTVWVTAHPSQRFHGGGVNYGMSGKS
jgi:hypothetical protein